MELLKFVCLIVALLVTFGSINYVVKGLLIPVQNLVWMALGWSGFIYLQWLR